MHYFEMKNASPSHTPCSRRFRDLDLVSRLWLLVQLLDPPPHPTAFVTNRTHCFTGGAALWSHARAGDVSDIASILARYRGVERSHFARGLRLTDRPNSCFRSVDTITLTPMPRPSIDRLKPARQRRPGRLRLLYTSVSVGVRACVLLRSLFPYVPRRSPSPCLED